MLTAKLQVEIEDLRTRAMRCAISVPRGSVLPSHAGQETLPGRELSRHCSGNLCTLIRARKRDSDDGTGKVTARSPGLRNVLDTLYAVGLFFHRYDLQPRDERFDFDLLRFSHDDADCISHFNGCFLHKDNLRMTSDFFWSLPSHRKS